MPASSRRPERKRRRWLASPSKIASTRSRTGSTSSCSPPIARATISSGSPITIDRDNDKNPVVALREIADGTLATDELYEDAVESHQRHIEVDEPEEDNMALLMAGGAEAAPQPSIDDLDEEKLLRALMAEQGR